MDDPTAAEVEPVLLALPARPGSADGEPALERLHVIETDSGPPTERALLLEALRRSPGLGDALADPAEVHGYHHPLAAVNAYKHRLHALRCDYVNARLAALELEDQLREARARIVRLENHIQFLDGVLEPMLASRAWKLVEKCSRARRTVLSWFGRAA